MVKLKLPFETLLCVSTIICSIILFLQEKNLNEIAIEIQGKSVYIKTENKIIGIRCLSLHSITSLATINPQGSVEYNASFLSAIRHGLKKGVNFIFEIGVYENQPFVQFFISVLGNDFTQIDLVLQKETIRTEAILLASFKDIEIKQLEETELLNAVCRGPLKRLLEVKTCRKLKNFESNVLLTITGQPRVALFENASQLDRFFSSLLQTGFSVQFTCVFSTAKPKWKRERLEHQWKQIRAKERKKEDSLKDQTCKRELVKKFEASSNPSGWFEVSLYLFLHPSKIYTIDEAKDALTGIILSIWGQEDQLEIKYKKMKAKLVCRMLTRRHIDSQRLHLSHLSSFVHLPTQPLPQLSTNKTPVFEIPPKNLIENELVIGWSVYKNRRLTPVGLKTEWLREHIAVLGATGTGKTTLVRKIMSELSLKTNIPWCIFDIKGSEYTELLKIKDCEITVIQLGKDPTFTLELLDSSIEKTNNAFHSTFVILRELLRENNASSELSPAMEKLLRESLEKLSRVPSGERTIAKLCEIINQTSSNDHWSTMTKDALLNRLEILYREPLKTIFSGGPNLVKIQKLLAKRVIFDLSYIVRYGGMDAARILYNLIAKRIFSAAMKRGVSEGLHHVVVLEEASNLVPESYIRHSAADISTGESMVMLQRATGQGVIVISTRPNISSNILANTGTKIVFRLPYDSSVGGRFLTLDEGQEKYLRLLKIGRAIMVTPVTNAFEIETVRPHKHNVPTSTILKKEIHSKSVKSTGLAKKNDNLPVKSLDPKEDGKLLFSKKTVLSQLITEILLDKKYLTDNEISAIFLRNDNNLLEQDIIEELHELIALGTIEREAIGTAKNGYIYVLPDHKKEALQKAVFDFIIHSLNLSEHAFRIEEDTLFVDKLAFIVYMDYIRLSSLSETISFLKSKIWNIENNFRNIILIVRGSIAAAKVREQLENVSEFSQIIVIPAFPNAIKKAVSLTKNHVPLDSIGFKTNPNISNNFKISEYQTTKLGSSSNKMKKTKIFAPAIQNNIWTKLIVKFLELNGEKVLWDDLLDFLVTSEIQSKSQHATPLESQYGKQVLFDLLTESSLIKLRITSHSKLSNFETGVWIVTKKYYKEIKRLVLESIVQTLKEKKVQVFLGHHKFDLCAGLTSYVIFPINFNSTLLSTTPFCPTCKTQKLVYILPAKEYIDNIEQFSEDIILTSIDQEIKNILY